MRWGVWRQALISFMVGVAAVVLLTILLSLGQRSGERIFLGQEIPPSETEEHCEISASFECGEQILNLVKREKLSESELTLHLKCKLKHAFKECISIRKQDCLDLATSRSVLLEMLSEERILTQQDNLYKILWTPGGCAYGNYHERKDVEVKVSRRGEKIKLIRIEVEWGSSSL